MLSTDLMTDAFGRVREAVHAVLVGAGPDLLEFRADPEANSIAGLVGTSPGCRTTTCPT